MLYIIRMIRRNSQWIWDVIPNRSSLGYGPSWSRMFHLSFVFSAILFFPSHFGVPEARSMESAIAHFVPVPSGLSGAEKLCSSKTWSIHRDAWTRWCIIRFASCWSEINVLH